MTALSPVGVSQANRRQMGRGYQRWPKHTATIGPNENTLIMANTEKWAANPSDALYLACGDGWVTLDEMV